MKRDTKTAELPKKKRILVGVRFDEPIAERLAELAAQDKRSLAKFAEVKLEELCK